MVLNYVQHIFVGGGGEKISWGGLATTGYGPVWYPALSLRVSLELSVNLLPTLCANVDVQIPLFNKSLSFLIFSVRPAAY